MSSGGVVRRRLVGLLVLFAGVAFAASMMTVIIAIAIWPGEAKLTAPLFCPDDQPDAYVVSDTYNPAPGETVTNFTLYCVGERGDTTDVGFFKPFVALTVAHGLLDLLVLGLSPILGGPGRIRLRTRTRDAVITDQLARSMGRGVDEPTEIVTTWPDEDAQ